MTMTTARYQAIPTDARASVRKCSTDSDLTARFVREVVPLRETLCRHAFSLCRNYSDAEDLVQETMLKAYLAFHSFWSGTNLRAWLLRIVTNGYINHYRKARRHPMLYSTEEMTDEHLAQVSARRTAAVLRSAEEQWLDSLPDHGIEAAMRALPVQFREVVYYRDVEGLRHREIAALMNIPCGTVVSRLHRGRRRLRGLLGDATDSPPDHAD
jgi:RNA polymerase sigma-70 factor, ECF subfamily